MAFTDKQRKALAAKLSHRHVKSRSNQGATISYVEGWHSIAEANRIFGYDSWDRQTQSPRCIWSEMQRGEVVCFYSTKVRITVRAGGTTTVRDGIGTGIGRSSLSDLAHDIALKAAETDATKRALATFGNPFGLALYDKDQTQVTKPTRSSAVPPQKTAPLLLEEPTAPLVLRSLGNREERYGSPDAFVAAVLKIIMSLSTIDDVYAFWDANMASFSALRLRSQGLGNDPSIAIVSSLKGRARLLSEVPKAEPAAPPLIEARTARTSDQAGLAFPKEKRLRDRDHLVFVANQPCLVCGRKPAQAHHIRFAQQRAMSLKVSDEYTVPLCTTHHDALHRAGDEKAWWARHGIIEPLKFADRLWAASRMAVPIELEDTQADTTDAGSAGKSPASAEEKRETRPSARS